MYLFSFIKCIIRLTQDRGRWHRNSDLNPSSGIKKAVNDGDNDIGRYTI